MGTARAARVAALRERDGDDCPWCGEPLAFGRVPEGAPLSLTIDEVVPRAAGGRPVLANQQLLHRACNQEKGSWHAGLQWQRERGRTDFARAARPSPAEADLIAGWLGLDRRDLRGHPYRSWLMPMIALIRHRDMTEASGLLDEAARQASTCHYRRMEGRLVTAMRRRGPGSLPG